MTISRNWLSSILLFLLATALIVKVAQAQTAGQSSPPETPDKASSQKRVTAKDSIVVGAHLTPEEIEDGKINDVYQPLYHWKKPSDCQQIVTLCETKIIPMAESSKFDLTRNKFLFLANREIAGCEMNSGQYEEAEKRFQRLFEFMPVWPGMDDSDYPINYQSIGTARMMQKRWKDAIEALEKSVAIFEKQIDLAAHSESEFIRNEHGRNLKMSDAQARSLLAAAYFQGGRQSETLETLEKSYQEAIESNASPQLVQLIIDSGRAASTSLGDDAAKAKWSSRTPPPKN